MRGSHVTSFGLGITASIVAIGVWNHDPNTIFWGGFFGLIAFAITCAFVSDDM